MAFFAFPAENWANVRGDDEYSDEKSEDEDVTNTFDRLKVLNPEYVMQLMTRNEKLRELFEYEISASSIRLRRTYVHDRAETAVSEDLHIFYRYFISKCIFNLQSSHARSGLLLNYASIFPFKVNTYVKTGSEAICKFFDDIFMEEIRRFIEHYIIYDSDFCDLEFLLVSNIANFRRRNFTKWFPITYERLKAIAEIGSHELEQAEEPDISYVCECLNYSYRLTETGINWYMNLQTACNEVHALYGKELIPTKGRAYFQYLPEINCCELLLLLEPEFFQHERERYVYLFKKYLFFFAHAVERFNEVHPVIFIDDTLYACLTSLSTYVLSKSNVMQLIWELWMMALVHFRNYHPSQPAIPAERTPVDMQNLRMVANYVAQIPNIRSAHAYDEESVYPVRHRNFWVIGNKMYRFTYLKTKKLTVELFYELILKAALLEEAIVKIVIYNAYTGEQASIRMPNNVESIRDLIAATHVKIPKHVRYRHSLCVLMRFWKWEIFRLREDCRCLEAFLMRDREKCFSTSKVQLYSHVFLDFFQVFLDLVFFYESLDF